MGRHPRRLRGHHQISRKEWGIDFNIPLDGGQLMIGDKIDVIIAVEAVLEQAPPDPRLTSRRTTPVLRTAPGHLTGGRSASPRRLR